jgi:hypothetical protein
VPRYYFHTEDSRQWSDRDGVDLPDPAAARREAVRALAEMLRERSDAFWDEGLLRMRVADGTGLTLFLIEVVATVAPAAG